MSSTRRLVVAIVQILLFNHVFVLGAPASTSRSSFLNTIQKQVAALKNKYAPHANSTLLSDLLPTGSQYTITQNAPDPLFRAAAIDVKRLGFLYGPAVGGGPYYPSGPLGLAKVANDVADIQLELTPELTNTVLDAAKATANEGQYDGLTTLDDYTKLYNQEWQRTLPRGPDNGAESNYTQDLFFSMERLSMSPYQVRRLNPKSDTPAFQVSSAIANKVCGMDLSSLLSNGRLFYADYRDQGQLQKTSHYAAASDAFFCIDKNSGNFLPLAIRTNAGAGPIYTPEDTTDDWLSAKMMLTCDDFWFSQINHLAATHEVVQIAYMAAIRTLSVEHPVQAVLDRVMYEVFAIQPLAATVLFAPGAAVDTVFPYTGTAAQSYSTTQYTTRGFGQFQANYFLTDLQNRGLVNSSFGPTLKSFPFYEDAGTIHDAIQTFATSFVNSYYGSDAAVVADTEIQNWATEAQGPAQAIDFPNISSRQSLIDIITHFAHLASPSHHTSNTNELLQIASAFPFHSAALYRKPPKTKPAGGTGINPVEYLPPYNHVLDALTVAALFARPLLVNTDRTLLHMFDDQEMLANMNSQTQAAANTFLEAMTAFGNVVGSRSFDSDGLSQGMPFIWQALDPNVAPYSVST